MAVGLVVLAGILYFMLRRSREKPEGILHVDGKNEMDAVASERKDTRVCELESDRGFVGLGAESVPMEIGESYGPRAEMG